MKYTIGVLLIILAVGFGYGFRAITEKSIVLENSKTQIPLTPQEDISEESITTHFVFISEVYQEDGRWFLRVDQELERGPCGSEFIGQDECVIQGFQRKIGTLYELDGKIIPINVGAKIILRDAGGMEKEEVTFLTLSTFTKGYENTFWTAPHDGQRMEAVYEVGINPRGEVVYFKQQYQS